MSTQTIEWRRPRLAALVYVLAAVMLLFIGILIYVWIEARKANPVMLDEQGRPRASAVFLSQA